MHAPTLREPILVVFQTPHDAEIRIPHELPIPCFNVPEVISLARKIGQRVGRAVVVE